MKTSILLHERVCELRKQTRLKQSELGEALGLSNKTICAIEKGYRKTTVDKLVILAEYFHVSTDYLLGITDDPAWRGPEEGP